jgi:hypothetical protein
LSNVVDETVKHTPTPTPTVAEAVQVSAVAAGGTGDFLPGWGRAGGGGRELTPRIVGPHGVKSHHAFRVICVNLRSHDREGLMANVAPVNILCPGQAVPSRLGVSLAFR